MTGHPGLDAAVAAGVIDRATAERLEPYIAAGGAPDTADPDDEKLRLVTGFNDIFVTIGLMMFLGAMYVLLGALSPFIVAFTAWCLAEYFTRKRRLALPSSVLLIIFVAAVFLGTLNLFHPGQMTGSPTPLQLVLAAFATAVAALLHWWRFHVPITIAGGVGAVAGLLLAICNLVAPQLITDHPVVVFLPIGLAIFALAMWFDSSDLKRQTRRTDIAFWLHLLAAPLIVHPLLISVVKGDDPFAGAAEVIIVFLCLAAVALVVDRRAILVSSLAYLAYATGKLISAAGLGSASLAMSTLAVGAVVLLLSAMWRPLRRVCIGLLPQAVRARLPAVA